MELRKGGPLEGLKILDMTRVLSGPFATCWLSDMGATVIKLEAPDGSSGRGENEIDNYFATHNRNKKCITLDLKNPKGKEMFLELVKQVDVVTENFRPGVMARLGLGFEDLRAVNEKIVMVSISGYGQTGPYSQRPGYDPVGQAMGGIMSITGEKGGGPLRCGPSIGDITSGMNMVIGILASMYRVKETGKGEWVDISLVDSVLGLCSSDYASYHKNGRQMSPRIGNDYNGWTPYGGGFQATDGYFNVGVGDEKYWRLLCENVLGRPELAVDPRFCGHPARVEHREETNKLIADWCADLSVAEAVERLNKGGVPAAKVYDFADIDADEHFTVHRKMVRTMEHPILGELHYVSVPPIFKEAGLSDVAPAELLGQSNEEVYSECLGLSSEEIAELKKNGII